jgi:hypothetical protein
MIVPQAVLAIVAFFKLTLFSLPIPCPVWFWVAVAALLKNKIKKFWVRAAAN